MKGKKLIKIKKMKHKPWIPYYQVMMLIGALGLALVLVVLYSYTYELKPPWIDDENRSCFMYRAAKYCCEQHPSVVVLWDYETNVSNVSVTNCEKYRKIS